LYSQCKKLKTVPEDPVEEEEDDATTDVSIDNHDKSSRRKGCCSNFKALWTFRPQSQAYLYSQLFGTDDPALHPQIQQPFNITPFADDVGSQAETAKFKA
jgi:hypothetical protein